MFLGHFSLALAAKRAEPRLSLGLTFAAAQTLDLVWPVLVLSGVERLRIVPGLSAASPIDFEHYPYSHSLLTTALWALLAFGAARLARLSVKASALLGSLVLSHWLLDLLVHVPDLPLTLADTPKLGLGLWHSQVLSIALELGLFAAGIALYYSVTAAKDRVGRWALPGLLALLALIQVASTFGPPPPEAKAVAFSALGMWLFVAWAAYADRHRQEL